MDSSQPKIYIVKSYKDGTISSAASHTNELVKALKSIGADINVIEPDEDKLSLIDSFFYINSIKKKVKPTDIIHVRSLRLAYLMSLPFFKPKAQILLEANGIWSEEHGTKGLNLSLVKHMENRAIKKSEAIVCVTPWIAQEFIQRGFSEFKFHIIENGVDTDKFKSIKDIPAKTELSEKISKGLKKQGMNFVGPTIIYSFMQAVGMVNDHEVSCFRYKVC